VVVLESALTRGIKGRRENKNCAGAEIVDTQPDIIFCFKILNLLFYRSRFPDCSSMVILAAKLDNSLRRKMPLPRVTGADVANPLDRRHFLVGANASLKETIKQHFF
jgi:hypothetical protein